MAEVDKALLTGDHQTQLLPAGGTTQFSDELFKQVIEACPSGVLLVDHAGVIIFANASALRCFGYKDEELSGLSIETLVPVAFRERHPALRREYFERPVPRAMGEARDLNGVRKDGTEVPVEIGLSPLRLRDGMQVLVNVVDISQRKRLEAELRAKNEEMEQLIYIVSHDLRSPLVTIEGFASMIGDHLKAHQLEQVGDDVARVRRAAATMGRLIHDVLELSRAGRQTIKPEDVSAREVLDDVAVSMDATLKQAQARLVVAGLPETVVADRIQLLQVFMNLIGNAVKHGCPEPGGVITIGGERRRTEYAFFVRDNGPGVDPRLQEKIFKPFQRGDHHRDGAGLGLAIVSKIAERHSGRTWVESEPGDGTTFWFTLPINLARFRSEQPTSP